MYSCPKCKKFASVGPGHCWKCGAELVEANSPVQVLRLTLHLPRILFVGAIDGIPELDFIRHLRWLRCIAYITSYGDRSSELKSLHRTTRGRADIITEGGIDATDLLKAYPNTRFDAVVWIGPTNDDNLEETPQLVGLFVESAGKVLVQGGVVFVVQDLKTPNFRPILLLPGANFCCDLVLSGRKQTQRSSARRSLAGRSDQLIAFTFDGSEIRPLNDSGNAAFIDLLTRIMSVPSKEWAPEILGKQTKPCCTKKEIADLIFAYANSMVEPPRVEPPQIREQEERDTPSGIYRCPSCKKFARIGPGACWKCGVPLQAD